MACSLIMRSCQHYDYSKSTHFDASKKARLKALFPLSRKNAWIDESTPLDSSCLNDKIVHFDSHSDFHHFVYRESKSIVFTVLVKTLVHRARNIALCGRHRIWRKTWMRIFNVEKNSIDENAWTWLNGFIMNTNENTMNNENETPIMNGTGIKWSQYVHF